MTGAWWALWLLCAASVWMNWRQAALIRRQHALLVELAGSMPEAGEEVPVAFFDESAVRLPPGPVDDDNWWGHCRHCADPCPQVGHDEPCMDCPDYQEGRP